MDLVHSHSVKNVAEGLNIFDGNPWQYFHNGPRRNIRRGTHSALTTGNPRYCISCFQTAATGWKNIILTDFVLTVVTSMLYQHHGLSRDFTEYAQYFDGTDDPDAMSYLILANKLIHQCGPGRSASPKK